MTLWHFPALFATGLAAGFVDSIAGGGGLISLPVLLSLGIPPHEALGTNKLQATFGSGGATWHYGRAGLIAFKESWVGFGLSFGGAVLGSLAVRSLKADLLKQLIPWLLLGIALYMLVQPELGRTDGRPRMPARVFYLAAGLSLGFYDGFFGPGTGTFWALAFVLGPGFNLTRATAHTKLMNFASNAGSLAVFLAASQVLYAAGLTMGLGQWLGARLGARMVVRRGTRFIRPVFITVVLAITARLLYLNFAAR